MPELELLAVAWALKKTRCLVLGRSDVTVIVDHKPLLAIINEKFADTIITPRLRRLKEKVDLYNVIASWKPGHLHHAPDALSRNPVHSTEEDGEVDVLSDGWIL